MEKNIKKYKNQVDTEMPIAIKDSVKFIKYISKELSIKDKEKIEKLIEDEDFLSHFKITRASPTGGKSKGGSVADDISDELVKAYKKFQKAIDKKVLKKNGEKIDSKLSPVGCMWYLKSKKINCCGETIDNKFLIMKDEIPLCKTCFEKKSKNKFLTYLETNGIIEKTTKSPSVEKVLKKATKDDASENDSSDSSDDDKQVSKKKSKKDSDSEEEKSSKKSKKDDSDSDHEEKSSKKSKKDDSDHEEKSSKKSKKVSPAKKPTSKKRSSIVSKPKLESSSDSDDTDEMES